MKSVKIFLGRPLFSSETLISMTVEINQKKLYYNYYTSGKLIKLKFKFPTPPPPQLQMLRYIPEYDYIEYSSYSMLHNLILDDRLQFQTMHFIMMRPWMLRHVVIR